MGEGLNRATLLGNLGADPELRFTQNGGAVLNFRICTNTRYKDRNDEWQDREEWHSVVVWGKRGEALEKILSKGSSVYIEGEIRTSSYEDKNGDKRYKTEIHANTVILAGGGNGGGRRDRDDDDDNRRGRGRDRDDDRRSGGRDREDDRRDGRRRNAAEDMKRRADERHERARRGEDDDDRRPTDDLPY